jgi:hypothetical protein
VNKIKNLLFLSLAFTLCLAGAPVTAKASGNQAGALACTFQGAWLEDANCTANRSTVYTVGNGALRTASGAGNFTWAYPASNSLDRAFRVCVYDEDYQLETQCSPWW